MKKIIKFLFRLLPDKWAIQIEFFRRFKRFANLKNPQTFNEKLQWLKLYDRKDIYTTMVDKYAVKKYVSDIIGEEHIIPTLGVWERFEDIDFDALPNQFVLKTTHDSGGVIICKDKSIFDKDAAKRKIEKSLRTNYYWSGREWPYKNVKPRIIAERYMQNTDGCDLQDYKFFCFNGDPKMILVCLDRFSDSGLSENFYDTNWNLMPVYRPKHPNSKRVVLLPENFTNMIAIARVLSENTSFSRIDLYDIDGKVYFGEITFFPASGFEKFVPEDWDYKLGQWLKLTKKPNNRNGFKLG